MTIKLVFSNLLICATVYLFYCWIVPKFFPDYRSYLPVLIGMLVAWLLSYRSIKNRGANNLVAIGGGMIFALVVAGVSLASITLTRGS